ncbi:GIY-YIG nuclease family protein [Acidobacteriia bacterium AH_259_A11_L15]|nr:GIY-YIG nuclease family protein [Acidobacteriia bacterium AH_259_A11_L15]
MYFVYILRSLATGRYYVGFTSDVTQRVGQHNAGVTKSTRGQAWELVHQESFATRAEAMRRERYLKTGKGREEVRRLAGRSSTRGSVG